jgi:hypothetical protein
MESEREALGELLNQTYRRSNSNNANDGTASEREHSQGMAKILRRRSARNPQSTEVGFVKTASILAWW